MSAINNDQPCVLAIIGAGPTCTYAIERLAANFNHFRERLRPCTIYIFDKTGHFGSGEVHSPTQSKTSFLNRIAGQVCFAADESNVNAGPLLPPKYRLTLSEWCLNKYQETKDNRYQLGSQDWPKRALHGEALKIHFDEYITLLNNLDHVTVNLIKGEVFDIEKVGEQFKVVSNQHPDILCDQLLLATGHSANHPESSAPYKILAAHAQQNENIDFINYAYPLVDNLQNIDASQTVAVQGLGLTAIDVFLYLTEGSGGQFKKNSSQEYIYIPSGREPKLIGFSRSGLFTMTRPHNEKERDIQNLEHKGFFFHQRIIDQLRKYRGIGKFNKLDFELHLWPLIRLEQSYLYYKTLFGEQFGEHIKRTVGSDVDSFIKANLEHSRNGEKAALYFENIINEVVDNLIHTIESILNQTYQSPSLFTDELIRSAAIHYFKYYSGINLHTELQGSPLNSSVFSIIYEQLTSPWDHDKNIRAHKYSWEKINHPIKANLSGPEYTKAIIEFMEKDIKNAKQNNLDNPVKALCDGVWRDLRQVMAYAIDDGGLTPSSHKTFLHKYMRIHNRLGNGASLEVMQKMLALVKAEVLDISLGYNPVIKTSSTKGYTISDGDGKHAFIANIIINAKIHEFHAENDITPLYQNMLDRGLVTLWENKHETESPFQPGGLQLTDQFKPVNKDGIAESGITLLGPPTEGKYFFQIGAARPRQNHHIFNDISCWSNQFISHLKYPIKETHQPTVQDLRKHASKINRTAIILLAGIGKRMGKDLPKSLIPFKEPDSNESFTLIERNIRLLKESGIDNFVLVVNAQNSQQFRPFENTNVSLVTNYSDVKHTGSSLSLSYALNFIEENSTQLVDELFILDGDIIFEKKLAKFIVQSNLGSSLFVTPNISKDEEEVRVYLQQNKPKLIGKGISPKIANKLKLAGESLGIIKIVENDLSLLKNLTTWLCGSPLSQKAFGYAKKKSEHEEIWQYFFNLESLLIVAVDQDMVFAECDNQEDLRYIQQTLLAQIIKNDRQFEMEHNDL
ncbi:Sden_1164 family protein [uncultured Shewanella sp.]|uniref:Sden_1164 family protein n=1 Tax=uncultured Shewanella sp. TaxID=173975 RepID=UPI0026260422|nr:Sden_1164 family protein [uncultured Shewanella sp.]